jgi:hypothetical protein
MGWSGSGKGCPIPAWNGFEASWKSSLDIIDHLVHVGFSASEPWSWTSPGGPDTVLSIASPIRHEITTSNR